jgi:hypothetical protein
MQLQEERRVAKEREDKMREIEVKAEQERKEWVEKDQMRSGAIGEIVKTSEQMYKALEEEKERNMMQEKALRESMEDERLEMERKLRASKGDLERVMEEQAMALKETRKAMAGAGVVPEMEESPTRTNGKMMGGHSKETVKATKRSSMHMSVPDVGDVEDWKKRFGTGD